MTHPRLPCGTLPRGNLYFFGDGRTPSRQEKKFLCVVCGYDTQVTATDGLHFFTSTPDTFPGGVRGGTPPGIKNGTLGVTGRNTGCDGIKNGTLGVTGPTPNTFPGGVRGGTPPGKKTQHWVLRVTY